MAEPRKRMSAGKKVLIGFLVLIVIAGAAFHIFITRYLPPIVKNRLAEIIVKGSDSLYKFEVGKFDLSFWGGSVYFEDLHISIDSNRYEQMRAAKKLPPLSCDLVLKKGRVNGISLRALIFSKRIDVREIIFDSADLQLARHFRTSEEPTTQGDPLWKLIQPRIRSIHIGNIYCADMKMSYKNIDSAAAFRWEFEKSNLLLSDIRVDSASAMDSTRLLFAKDLVFNAKMLKMATSSGLYTMKAGDIAYSSARRSLELKQFDLSPAMSDQQFVAHFGYQHEIYKLKVPAIRMTNFALSTWVTGNKLQSDTVVLSSPSIAITLDRNAAPNTKSKKGGYPHQLLQKLPFLVQVKRLTANGTTMSYTETSNMTNRKGRVDLAISGAIDNITNDPVALQRSGEAIAYIQGTIMKTGKIDAVFRFNLEDKSGAFSVKSTITHLDANQLRPIFTAMTAVEMQSLTMRRLDYTMTGNEDAGVGSLSMQYGDLDILINKVTPDKSLDKKGFLSFLTNRLLIYKENPVDGEERKASSIHVSRDMTRSFFNLVWKTMFASLGEIVLRPLAQRKIEKRKERQERKEERKEQRNSRKK